MQIIFNIFWQRPAALFFFALRWIMMSDAVTCTIPGAKRPAQVEENVRAADLQPLPDAMMTKVREVYGRRIREKVHHYW